MTHPTIPPQVLQEITEAANSADGTWSNPSPRHDSPSHYVRTDGYWTTTVNEELHGACHVSRVNHLTLRIQHLDGHQAQALHRAVRQGVRQYAQQQLALCDLLADLSEDPFRDHHDRPFALPERDYALDIAYQARLATFSRKLHWTNTSAGPVSTETATLEDFIFTITFQPGPPPLFTVVTNDKLLARTSDPRPFQSEILSLINAIRDSRHHDSSPPGTHSHP